MRPQTEDNLRCLGAVVCFLTVTVAVGAAQPAWFLALPGWAQAAAVILLLVLLMHVFNYHRTTARDRVAFDASAITRTLPHGETESVRWDDLQEIEIRTASDGPWMEDVFWMLSGPKGGCVVSNGTQGMKELLVRLQQLPGFDNGVVIKAMGSTGDARFVCWKRA